MGVYKEPLVLCGSFIQQYVRPFKKKKKRDNVCEGKGLNHWVHTRTLIEKR